MRIAANTFFSLAQRGIGRFAGALTLIILARTQGPEVAGLFSLALTFHLLMTGWWVGIDDKIVREIARRRAATDKVGNKGTTSPSTCADTRHIVLDYVQVRGLVSLALLGVVAALIYAGRWYSPAETWFILVMLSSTVTDNMTLALVNAYVGHERFAPVFGIMALQTTLRLGLIGLTLVLQADMPAIAATWLVTSWLTTGLAWMLFAQHFPAQGLVGTVHGPTWRALIAPRADWSFLLMGIVVMLEYQVDVILLSLLRGAREVGYYSTATTLFALATLPVQAFRAALYPTMSRMAAFATAGEATPELQRLYGWSVSGVLSAGLLTALLGGFFAEPVIRLVFGPAMTPAALPTQLLMLGVVLFSLNVPHSRLLLATNRQNRAAQFITVSAIANVVANLWLAAWLGAPGTALARSISSATFLLLALGSVVAVVRLPNKRMVLPPVTAACVTAGFLLLTVGWPWWLAAACAVLLYAAVWWTMGGAAALRLYPTRFRS